MTIREIKQKIEVTSALEQLSIAYSDLAGQRLVAIREEILANRNFVSGLSQLFHIVKTAAVNSKTDLGLGKKGNVNLLITSNKRFYGGLERRLLDFFLAHSVLSYGQTIVVGETGLKYLEGASFPSPYQPFMLERDVPSLTELSSLVDVLLPFEKINVYYARMQTVLVQKPTVLEIGGMSDIPADVDPRETYYIFEPELLDMLKFFDRKIVQVLLAQAFYESELARTAARMVSMEQSRVNAGKAVGKLRSRLYRERGNMLTFNMLEIAAGLKPGSRD